MGNFRPDRLPFNNAEPIISSYGDSFLRLLWPFSRAVAPAPPPSSREGIEWARAVASGDPGDLAKCEAVQDFTGDRLAEAFRYQ